MRCHLVASPHLVGLLLTTTVAFAAPPQAVTLAVENMTCGTCPIVVRKALQRVPGVSSAEINFEKKTAHVTFDPDKTSVAQMTHATTDAGFPSKLVSKQ